jgi:hypothetical protein
VISIHHLENAWSLFACREFADVHPRREFAEVPPRRECADVDSLFVQALVGTPALQVARVNVFSGVYCQINRD